MHLFKSIISTKNEIFKNYMQLFKNEWEDDDPDITASYLIAKAKVKFANMTKGKDWSKNDPQGTQFFALMTKLQKRVDSKSGAKGRNSGD